MERHHTAAHVVSIVDRDAHGRIVVTGPRTALDEVDAPITLRIEDNGVIAIDGGKSARRFAAVLDALDDPAARHGPAEVGVARIPRKRPGRAGPVCPSSRVLPERSASGSATTISFLETPRRSDPWRLPTPGYRGLAGRSETGYWAVKGHLAGNLEDEWRLVMEALLDG